MVYPHIQYRGPAHPDASHGPDPEGARELDSRLNDGIDVRLLWHPTDGHVSVVVHDSKTEDAFELAVRDDEQARDVFHHPYAYAASRRALPAGSGPAADVAVGVRAAV